MTIWALKCELARTLPETTAIVYVDSETEETHSLRKPKLLTFLTTKYVRQATPDTKRSSMMKMPSLGFIVRAWKRLLRRRNEVLPADVVSRLALAVQSSHEQNDFGCLADRVEHCR